ncbi:helix-turn-helix domain-containing protein [Rathayibacter soli]|uniref:helix-turn-helix domain-containing protein n=1 Tax=Rathayibacter soli TaxID=3144168 RepID=UPI0027E52474|nr:helix-turn-helix domain-containing protein [Glaciibacter superstes]
MSGGQYSNATAFYAHGASVVVLPGVVCAFLERYSNISEVRIRARGANPGISAALEAVQLAAMAWASTGTGTKVEKSPEHGADWRDTLLGTAEAARLLGITERAVRKAIERERLEAVKDDSGRWQISRHELEQYHRAVRAKSAVAA